MPERKLTGESHFVGTFTGVSGTSQIHTSKNGSNEKEMWKRKARGKKSISSNVGIGGQKKERSRVFS